MSCYNPRLAFRCGEYDSGRPRYQICSFTDDVLDKFPPQDLKLIPCGKCLGCRLQYSKEWSDRIMMEAACHDFSYFITLTYDDEHIPLIYDDDSGVVFPTLRKKDVQDFIKRLRDHFPYDHIRYYIAGEYSPAFRPHYHCIIFGLHLTDCIRKSGTKLSLDKYLILHSPQIEKIWGKGFIDIGSVTSASAGYVARYCLKKVGASSSDLHGREPEFSVMSRKPAIGRLYFDEHPDCFDNGELFLPSDRGSVKIFPSRYFRKLLDSPERKARSYVNAKSRRESIKSRIQVPESVYYSNLEKLKQKQTNILKNRNKIK